MNRPLTLSLEHRIKDEARRLGFILAGVTTPDPPQHFSSFETWLMQGRHASMDYLAGDRSRARRADPRLILPNCKSILILAIPYSKPGDIPQPTPRGDITAERLEGKIAAYALGNDYHIVLPKRLKVLVRYIEEQVGHPVSNRLYTDTGPVLERDLAQRAGLGWIGKNTCLIHPKQGSYFLLAEILLDLDLQPDAPFTTDHCGKCSRCMEACPTDCILPDRTIDARRCISYLTIELKDSIARELRPLISNWVFGCDICQQVCPWNRFAPADGDPDFKPHEVFSALNLIQVLQMTPSDFNRQFKDSPIRRAKRRGYLRNAAVAQGNEGGLDTIPSLEEATRDPEPIVSEHAAWAIVQISRRHGEAK